MHSILDFCPGPARKKTKLDLTVLMYILCLILLLLVAGQTHLTFASLSDIAHFLWLIRNSRVWVKNMTVSLDYYYSFLIHFHNQYDNSSIKKRDSWSWFKKEKVEMKRKLSFSKPPILNIFLGVSVFLGISFARSCNTFYSDSRYSIVQGLQSGAWLGVTIRTATTYP